MAYQTVGELIAEARRLLQDEVAPTRYPDTAFTAALNLALLEVRRLRYDLVLGVTHPTYTVAGQTVEMDPAYRPALTYYMAGRVGLENSESADQSIAASFMNKFTAQLLTVQS